MSFRMFYSFFPWESSNNLFFFSPSTPSCFLVVSVVFWRILIDWNLWLLICGLVFNFLEKFVFCFVRVCSVFFFFGLVLALMFWFGFLGVCVCNLWSVWCLGPWQSSDSIICDLKGFSKSITRGGMYSWGTLSLDEHSQKCEVVSNFKPDGLKICQG